MAQLTKSQQKAIIQEERHIQMKQFEKNKNDDHAREKNRKTLKQLDIAIRNLDKRLR